MLVVLLLVIIGCVVGRVAARRRSSALARALGVVCASVLFAIAAWFVWYLLWLTQVVPVDAMLRSYGVYYLEPRWFRVLFLGPPLLAATLFGIVLWRRTLRGDGKRIPPM